jgi:hypothetical protein
MKFTPCRSLIWLVRYLRTTSLNWRGSGIFSEMKFKDDRPLATPEAAERKAA